jgi:hypothetical protein
MPLMHMREEHLEQYALGKLPDELAGVVESHLKECVPCGIRFEESRGSIGEWPAMPGKTRTARGDRRKSPRTETDDPAVMTILKPDRSARIKVRILDASKEGLKILVPNELMKGMLVQVNVRDLFILAEVRYCRRSGAVFHAGVFIQDVFPAAG